jgi:uncharacterized membrane protein
LAVRVPDPGTERHAARRNFMTPRLLLFAAPLVLTACNAAEAPVGSDTAGALGSGLVPGDTSDTHAYDGIRADETVHFTGTEPFWGGQVSATTLTYSTPEDPEGSPVTVARFAGRGGVSWSGTWQDRPFRLAVTEGACSDGMSDRAYPFTATLEVLGEQRQGCAWTERRGFSPPSGGT